jgi:hypothetical protein
MSQKETYTLRHSWDETTKSSLVHTLICLKRYSYMSLQWKWDSNGNLRWDNLAISRAFQQNPICNTWQLLFLPTFRNNFRLTEEKKKKKKKDRKHSMIVSNGGTHVDYYVCNHSIRTFFSTFFFLQIGKLTL